MDSDELHISSEEFARERAAVDAMLAAGERASLVERYRRLVAAAGAAADADLLRAFGICLDAVGSREALPVFKRVLAIDPRDSVARSRVRRLEAGESDVRRPGRKAGGARTGSQPVRSHRPVPSHDDARRKFARVFPGHFADPGYLEHERDYKWAAHLLWKQLLSEEQYSGLVAAGNFAEVCRRLRQVNGAVNLLSRFESAALNDVTKTPQGAELLARSLYELVYGEADVGPGLDALVTGLQRLNARGTAPAKWPIVTFFPFIALPDRHLFVKPEATKLAAERLGFELNYKVVPNSLTYSRCTELAARLKDDLASWVPRDNIDIQGFIWVTYSSGY